MPRDLTNLFIADTYDTLLHMDGLSLSSAPQLVYDGVGNASSLQVALSAGGASISGPLCATGFKYPVTDGSSYDILTTDGAKTLGFTDLQTIINASSGILDDGTYVNPTVFVYNGKIITLTEGIPKSIKQLAHSWVSYDGVAQALRNSYNVTSVDYLSTGKYRINFTSPLSSSYPAIMITMLNSNAGSQARIVSYTANALIIQSQLDNTAWPYDDALSVVIYDG